MTVVAKRSFKYCSDVLSCKSVANGMANTHLRAVRCLQVDKRKSLTPEQVLMEKRRVMKKDKGLLRMVLKKNHKTTNV